VRFGARDYDASPGTWTVAEQSPQLRATSHGYRFSHLDPINYADRTGEYPVVAVAIGIAIFTAAYTIWNAYSAAAAAEECANRCRATLPDVSSGESCGEDTVARRRRQALCVQICAPNAPPIPLPRAPSP